MKKFLLITLAAVFAVNMSAQQKVGITAQKVKGDVLSMRQAQAAVDVTPGMRKAPRKNAANGVLYNRPAGTFYQAWDKEGRGYGQTFLIVPPLTDIVFENVSTATGDPIWTYSDTELDAEENGDLDFGSLHVQDPYDEAGGISYYYMPKLTIGKNSFTLGTEGKYSSYSSYGSGIAVDTLNTLSFVDQHNSGYGFGSLSTHYLYGTGLVNGTRTCFAVEQDFEKPAAPLYLQDAFLSYYSTQELPVPEGKQLILRFVALDEEGNLGEILGEMTADHESFSDIKDYTADIQAAFPDWEASNWYGGTVSFSNKTTDIFGNVVEEPVIINEAFAVVIEGIDEEGVSIGFTSTSITDGTNVPVAYFINKDSEGGKEDKIYYNYYSDESLNITFTGMFDVAMLSDDDSGEYIAPVEGGTVVSADDPEYDAAFVYTAYPWTDDLGNDNYFVYVEYPEGEEEEWLTTNVISDYWGEQNDNGNFYAVNLVDMEAAALPEGVAGRKATVYVFGPAAELSFVVTQGEVEEENPYDLNHDGKISAGDIQIIINEMKKAAEEQNLKYDLNGDGKISAGDIQIIINEMKKG